MNQAILYCEDANLKSVFKKELQNFGVAQVLVPKDAIECIDLIKSSEQALLIIDCDAGVATVNNILSKSRDNHALEMKSIILVANQGSNKIVGVAMEFGVSYLHVGPVSKDIFHQTLTKVLEKESLERVVREIMVIVARKLELGDLEDAEAYLEKSKIEHPKKNRLDVELANVKIYLGKWTEAVKILMPFKDLQQPYVRALHLLGRCLMKLKRFEEALDVLKRAKKASPLNLERILLLGNSSLQLGDTEEAKTYFQEAKKMDRGSKEAIIGESQCLMAEGEINEALALLKEVTDKRELASTFNSSAVVSMRKGDFEHGMSLYDHALSVLHSEPKLQARVVFNKGIGFLRTKKEEQAKKCFEEALKKDPSFKKSLEFLHRESPGSRKDNALSQSIAEKRIEMENNIDISNSILKEAESFDLEDDDIFFNDDQDEMTSL